MAKISILLLPLLLSVTLFGCGFAFEEAGIFKTNGKGLPQLGALQYAEQNVTFDIVKATALRNCLQCHSAGKNAMATADQANAMGSDILDEVNGGTMPPKSSGYPLLDSCEKQIFETWLDDQNHGRALGPKIKDLPACKDALPPATPEPKPDFKTLPVGFDNLKKYLLAPHCLSCHGSDVEDVKTVLDNTTSIRKKNLLGPTAEQSKLYQQTLPTAKFQMPPLKSGMPRLTADETAYLKKWIDAGAPETAGEHPAPPTDPAPSTDPTPIPSPAPSVGPSPSVAPSVSPTPTVSPTVAPTTPGT